MRAVNIGLGEIADRLSILALKIAHGEQAGKETTHFVNERNALLTMLRGYELAGVAEQLFDLAAVNGMLWYAEDDLREFRRSCGDKLPEGDRDTRDAVVLCAFRIQSLNDRRADLVWTLNKQAGTDLGQEKL